MKTKKLTILALALGFLLLQTTSGSALTVNGQDNLTCKEVTQYFNPTTLPELLQGQTSPNSFTACQPGHFEAFPGQHKQDKLNEHQAKKEYHEPWTEHRHAYINQSEEKLDPTLNIYQFSAIDTFELKLHQDFLQNVDLNSVQCAGLPDGNNCSGTGNFGTASDGGLVYYQVSFDKNAGIIRWHFPGKKGNAYYGSSGNTTWTKLYITGKNPTLDSIYGITANSSKSSLKEENRKLSLAINFKSKGSEKDFWSATVTSKTLLKDVQKKVAPSEKDVNKINQIPPEDVPHTKAAEAPADNYYWFSIGTTSTVWEKPLQPNVCQSLKPKLDTNTIQINGKTAYPITIESLTFTPKNEIPKDAKIKWTSTDDANGEFWKDVILAGNPYDPSEDITTQIKLGTGTVTTDVNTKIYYVGTKPTKIKAELTNIPQEQIGKTCYGYVFVPIEEVECKNLLIDHPKHIYENTASIFKAKGLGTDDNYLKTKIKYWVDPGYGEFYLIKPKNIPENKSEYVYEATPADSTIPAPDNDWKIDPKIIIYGNNATDLVNTSINVATEIGSGQFGIEDISSAINNPARLQEYAAKNFVEIPDWMSADITYKAEPGPSPTNTPNMTIPPSAFGQLNTLLALNFNIEPTLNPPIDTKDIMLQPETPVPSYINFNLFESITVDPDTIVYFWAKKPGKNVVHAQVLGSTVPDCSRNFDIEPQLLCRELNLITNTKGDLVIGQPAMININPKDTLGKKLPPTTKFKLSTTTDGKFQNSAGKNLGNIAVLSDFPIYLINATKAGTVTVEMDKTDPFYSGNCTGDIKVKEIPPKEQACIGFKTFDLKEFGSSTQATQLEKAKVYTLSASLNTKLPSENSISYTIDSQYGVFVKVDQTLVPIIATIIKNLTVELNYNNLSAALGANSLTYQTTLTENSQVLLVTFTNPPVSPVTKSDVLKIQGSGECTKLIPFVVPEQPKDCKSLDLTPVTSPFDPKFSNIFNITGDYKDYNGEIKVTISSNAQAGKNKPTIAKITGQSTADSLIFNKDEVTNQQIAKSFTYTSNDYNEETDTLNFTVDATNSSNPLCHIQKSYPPKTKGKECIDLDIIEPDSPWEVDTNDDEQLFEISVDANPSGHKNDLYYNWEVTDGAGQWKNDDKSVSDYNDFTQILENFDSDTEVKIWASENKNGSVMKDASGNNICVDTISAKQIGKKEKPEIEKYVYTLDKIKEADDTININSNTDYVTYMIIFAPGTDIKEAEISDSALNNGIIKSTSPSLNGTLNFIGMEIAVVKNTNSKNTSGKVLFKTGDYQKDNGASGKFDDFRDKNFDDDKDYEENECDHEKAKNKVCIETKADKPKDKDFADDAAKNILDQFENGYSLNFKNLDKLDQNDFIVIKYQMENNTVIDDGKCKNLKGECGEQFKNKAEFSAESKSDNDKTYEGDSTTKVIVICPYILTRQGGDVFFHDVIDTGIDVAQCSEVKSCDGPCITPEPPTTPTNVKTGAGDIPEDFIKLDLPSHDVCRYSNSANNLEGYNNVLTNFSSTICELKADISKAWTKKNITESINANVKRISRWDENLTTGSLNHVDNLETLNNHGSGVFVRKSGDLTIGNSGEYILSGNDAVPAAQTYVVIGHNLYINSNIKYDPNFTDYTKNKQIPSTAFIVINGNIFIDKNVKQIDGILMAVDLDNSGKGKILSQGGVSLVPLTINGNLIGNVYDLFYNRRGVGDPRKDEGSVTIRYDERILLNTPPAITDLVNLQQAIVPN